METEIEMARVTVVEHQCYCVIVYAHPKSQSGHRHPVRCEQVGLGPDEPFCETCEGRHPDAADDPFVVAVTYDSPAVGVVP